MEVGKKMETCRANMLKQYIGRKNDDVTPEVDLRDRQVTSGNACTGVVGVEEEVGVNDDQLME